MKKIFLSIGAACLLLCSCHKSNIPTITVTFDAEQGYFQTQAINKYYVTIEKGSLFYEAKQKTPAPTSKLDSYAFDSWNKDDSEVPDNLVLDSDLTVKAKYYYLEPITITYDLNGGSYGGDTNPISLKNYKNTTWSKAIKLDEKGIQPPADNFLEFDAWSFDKDELKSISAEQVFDSSITLYAHYRPTYLKFTAAEDASTISYTPNGVDTSGMEYSYNGYNWEPWTNAEILTLNSKDDFVYVRNKKNVLSLGEHHFVFKMTGSIFSSGNINSLINHQSALSANANFRALFYGCKALLSSPSLPFLTLTNECYQSMFQGCTSLISAPSLPALSLPNHAYHSMFLGCSSLKIGPADLPATTLNFECYRTMFSGCSSLETAPIIYARSAPNNSFFGMFQKCSALSYIKTYYAGTFNDNFKDWVKEVNNFGTIYYEGSSQTRDSNSIPENWVVEPRITLRTFTTNCSCEPETIDYHNGETIDVTLIPNAGYTLPDDVITNAEVYVYNKENSVFSFLGENKVIMLRIDAVKV